MSEFPKNSACFRNEQCHTGFCKNGACRNPEIQNDSCDPEVENCPKPFKCSKFSRTCVPFEYQKWIPCRSQSDCKFGDYCIEGKCKASRPIGSSCSSISPDLCKMGSKCTSLSQAESTKCYELCSKKVPCPSGYSCTENLWNVDPICVPKQQQEGQLEWNLEEYLDGEIIAAVLVILAFLVILLGAVYGWIKLTHSGKDPRLIIKKRKQKQKKKKVRLNYDGNGMATVTLIPSNCQSPNPVAASHLFDQNIIDPPPPYSEVINIQ